MNFQKEVRKLMIASGFEVGKYNVCTFLHKKKKLVTMVHGDDFVTTGDRDSCKWFKDKLSARFQIKTKVIGKGPGEVEEESVLNRVMRRTKEGWEYEADQRLADILVKSMNMSDAKPVPTAGKDQKGWEEESPARPIAGDRRHSGPAP